MQSGAQRNSCKLCAIYGVNPVIERTIKNSMICRKISRSCKISGWPPVETDELVASMNET